MGKTCPYCRHIMANEDQFCPECGKEYPTGKTCSFCGAAISDDDIFCQNCGVIVAKGKACPHCRAALNEGDAFCQNCGARIEKEEEVPRVEEKKEEEPVETEVKQERPKAVVAPQAKPVDSSPREEVTEEDSSDDYPEETNRSQKGKYVIIALIVLALIGGGVFFFLNNSSKDWESEGEIISSISTGKRTLYGTIGELPITMEIDIETSDVNGFLYYNKYGPSNRLFVSGSLHNNEIELKEHNKDGMETGNFNGKYSNGVFYGEYVNYKGDVYSFKLSEAEENTEEHFTQTEVESPKSPYDKYKGKWSAYMTDENGTRIKFLTISINDDLSADHYLYLPDGNTNHSHWEKCVFADGYVYFTINGDYSDTHTPKAAIDENGLLDGDGKPLVKE